MICHECKKEIRTGDSCAYGGKGIWFCGLCAMNGGAEEKNLKKARSFPTTEELNRMYTPEELNAMFGAKKDG